MKILVVCQYYYPEPFRIHEVCEALVQRGHEVTVLTGLPNYPMGVVPKEYQNGQHRDEIVNGVRVLRVNETPRSAGKIGLAKNYVSFVWHGCLKALRMKKDFDVIFVYQLSPVLMAIPAYVAKWFSRCKKISLYCLDLWPESLTSLGIGKNSVFFKFIKWVSIRIYKGTKTIGYTSRMFRTYFENELGIKKNELRYIPQFADELFSSVTSSESARGEYVNYVFAGNIGEMQSVDTIIKAAAINKDKPIRWHIVGDGFALDSCKKLCEELGANDVVKFYGRLPVEEMPRFYSMADAMIVTLADNDTISYTLPGKVQSYMAAGKAIIASANGETSIVVEDAQCGRCVDAQDEEAFAKIAVDIIDDDFTELGRKAREYYDSHFSKQSHVDEIEQLLKVTAES